MPPSMRKTYLNVFCIQSLYNKQVEDQNCHIR